MWSKGSLSYQLSREEGHEDEDPDAQGVFPRNNSEAGFKNDDFFKGQKNRTQKSDFL